jgi:ribosome maturation factor RimP
VNEALESVVVSELDRLQLDLVELRVGGSRSRPTLQVRVDRRDGGNVTVDDCAVASRAIEARLDAEHRVGDRYVLEVSSPGVERPLKNVSDWRRFVGRRASVLSPALNGREEVEIVALEGGESDAVVVVRTNRGTEQRIPLADVKEARLAFTW